MDIKDFEGMFKYKLFMPALYILSWIAMFTGPHFYPVAYQQYSIIMIGYLVFKVFIITFILLYIAIRNQMILSKMQAKQNDDYQEQLPNDMSHLLYGYIIPNYKEDLELLAETLDFLADQKRAK